MTESIKKFLETKSEHILIAEEMADRIYSKSDEEQIEMLEAIRQRLIKLKQKGLENLRKFNRT